MTTVVGVSSLQDQLDDIASDSSLEPAERITRLRSFRADLSALAGVADRYINDAELQREGGAMGRVRSFMEARAEADARGELLDGGTPPEVLDRAGVLSHAELDRRAADGSIEEAILGLPYDRELREAWSQAAREAALLARRRNLASRGHTVEPEHDRLQRAAASAKLPVPSAPRPASGGGLSEADVERMGLNKWPEQGEHAKRILQGHADTQQLHSVPGASPGSGAVYRASRKPVHDRIVGRALAGPAEALLGKEHAIAAKLRKGGTLSDDEKGTLRDAAAKARGGESPEALFMAGGSASGKSSALAKNPDLVPHAAVHIDPDAFKEQLPEYKSMIKNGERYAASGAHEESADLAKRANAEARDLGLNMVIDGTGNSGPGKFASKFHDAHKAGYGTKALYVTAPTDVAVQRAISRAQQSGRFVPIPEVRSQHQRVSANFPDIAALPFVKDLRVMDSGGEESRLIASGAKGKLQVHEPELHQAFLDKAREGA